MNVKISKGEVSMKNITLIITVIMTMLLTACGSQEPSEKDISEAIQKQTKAQLEGSTGIFKEEDITIRHIKKIACSEAEGKSGYLCDVDIDLDIKLPFVGVQKQTGIQSFRFIKNDDGWNVVR